MRGGELVEQCALHLGAGEPGGFLLKLAAQQALELFVAFQPERLGELVVEPGLALDLHVLDGDVEGDRLALEVLGRVIGGEGDVDRAVFTGLHPDELFLETGDEAARAQFQRGVFARAALERHAVELAEEVDHDLVASRGFLALLGGNEAFLARCDLGYRFIDFAVAHRHGQLFQLEPGDVGRGDIGQHFERDRDLRVLALGIAFAQRNFGLHRGAQLVVTDQLVHRLADRGIERIVVKRRAVHLAHEVGGHLAGPEAGHFDLRRDLFDLALDPGGNIPGGNGHREGALEAIAGGFGNLHVLLSFPYHPAGRGRRWCGRRDSNPHIRRYQNLNLARLPIPPRPLRSRNERGLYRQFPQRARRGMMPAERSGRAARLFG